MNTAEQQTEYLNRDLADMKLVELLRKGDAVLFYLKKHGTRIMSTLISFTREGIVLQGDLTPEHNGCVSCMGYGERWFSGKLSGGYLCEKFLMRKYVPQIAIESMDKDFKESWELTDEQIQQAKSAADSRNCGCELYDFLTDLGVEGECVPGYCYDPREACVLIAIQKRFAELHREMYPDGCPETKVRELD